MTDPKRLSEEQRDLLRGLILGTLGDNDRARVEAYVRSDPSWKAGLDAERTALAKLDALQAVQPDYDLTQAVLRRLNRGEGERAAARRPFRLMMWLAPAAAVILAAVIVLPIISRAREAERLSASANNMKQLGLIFKMYANESRGGKFPPLAPYDGVWIFDVSVLYPDFLVDLSILVSPELPNAGSLVNEIETLAGQEEIDWERITRIAALSYSYPSWVIGDPSDVEAMLEGRSRMAKADYDADIRVGDKTLYRLREGIERFMITDINNPGASATAQSNLPVLLETSRVVSRRKSREAAHVLYMDGHVKAHRVPAAAAIPKNTIGVLLDRLNSENP